MDALAGYGSGSDSDSDQEKPSEVGGLSGLLGDYSEDSDANENNGLASSEKNGGKGKLGDSATANGDKIAKDSDEVGEAKILNGHPKKRRRRWDNPNEDADASLNVGNVLPPPMLLATKTDSNSAGDVSQTVDNNPFQSMALFQKDYTSELRWKLSQQLQTQSQSKEMSPEKQQLSKKLEQLHDKFHKNNDEEEVADGASSASSFAEHLKSQHEFGNPHLLKTIIDHFHISPLRSHVGNHFQGFEYVERLMSAEERARIAAANFDVTGGGTNSGA